MRIDLTREAREVDPSTLSAELAVEDATDIDRLEAVEQAAAALFMAALTAFS